MRYDYYCTNPRCTERDKVIPIYKPMSESNRKEHCQICGLALSRTIESLVCGMSVDKTGTFYRKVN